MTRIPINYKILAYSLAAAGPLYLVRFSILGVPSTLLEVWIYFVAIVGLFIHWKNWSRIGHWKKWYQEQRQIILSFLLIIAGLIASTIASDDYRAGLGILKGWFLDPFLVFVIFTNTLKNTDDIRKILGYYFYSAATIAIISLIYKALGIVTYDGRLSGFYLSPNYLAMYLAPAALIGIFNKSKSYRWLKYLMLTSILVVVYLTYSYAAWVAIALSLMITKIIASKNKFHKLSIIPVVLLAIYILFSSQVNNEKMTNLFNPQNHSSLESRVTIWKSSFHILKDNWLFGIGPGNFQNSYLIYQKYFPPYPEWAVPHPHNLYLAFWLQAGLLGLVGFMSIVYFWFRSIFSALKNEKNHPLAILLFSIILYVLLHGLVDTPYWKNDLALFFWALIAAGSMFSSLTPTSPSYTADSIPVFAEK